MDTGISNSLNSILISLFAIAAVGSLGGMYVMQLRNLSRKVTAISGGIMLGIALFWISPDLTRTAGFAHSSLTVAVALAALYALDRFVYPVCPCCGAGRVMGYL